MYTHTTAIRRSGFKLFASLLVVAALVGACGSGGATSPAPPTAPPTSSPADGGSAAPDTGFRLRATTVQALAPIETFGWLPSLVISGDLVAIQAGAIPAIYPGPLVTPLLASQLTEAAWQTIVADARTAGLLSGASDFTGGGMPLGSAAGRVEMIVDGRTFDFTGDPSRVMRCITTPCVPGPGTPEAFGGFWERLGNLSGWLGSEVQASGPWDAPAYAVLAGPPPAQDPQLGSPPLAWPFAVPAASFGDPVKGDSARRCGVARGADAGALRTALGTATQLTRWGDAASPATLVGLTIRPLVPGDDDPCAVLTGS